MSNKGKIIAAAVIWIGVVFFGYRMYQKIAPALFGLPRGGPGRGGNRQDWQKQQAEAQEYFKEEVGSGIKLSVKRNKTGGGMSQSQSNDKGFYLVAYGSQIENIYAQLSQKPNWQVRQLPAGGNLWDVKMRGPASKHKEAAQYFLNYMNWQVKEKTVPQPGYRFVSSGGRLTAPTGRNPGNRGMRVPPLELKQFADNMQWLFRAPVKVDDDVATRKPLDTNARIGWQQNPDNAAALVAAAFGVGVIKEEIVGPAILVYHPKYASNIDVRKWEQGLLARD